VSAISLPTPPPDGHKPCRACGQTKPIAEFSVNDPRGRRRHHCKRCRADRTRDWKKTARGRAVVLWNAILDRLRHDDDYKDVELRVTREEFLTWAEPALADWAATRPDDRPSVDRVDPAGHYELNNLRLLEWGENARLSRKNHNVHAPDGTAWCRRCRAYRPATEFHRSRRAFNGLVTLCKPCAKQERRSQYLRHGQ
jgi:hypothetical protein